MASRFYSKPADSTILSLNVTCFLYLSFCVFIFFLDKYLKSIREKKRKEARRKKRAEAKRKLKKILTKKIYEQLYQYIRQMDRDERADHAALTGCGGWYASEHSHSSRNLIQHNGPLVDFLSWSVSRSVQPADIQVQSWCDYRTSWQKIILFILSWYLNHLN